MYNANYPKENELPSSKQLAISTLVALIAACILLVTAVLPAEYGVDPTGIGKPLGLTKMGKIKMQLAKEADSEVSVTPQAQEAKPAESIAEERITAQQIEYVKPESEPEPEVTVIPSETTSVTLAPAEAAEIKVAMSRGDIISYQWSVNTGHVNFDTHADNASTKYHNYNKGKAVQGDEGELKAAFDGKHGWFWRNRSGKTVTVTLQVSGQYTELKRVL